MSSTISLQSCCGGGGIEAVLRDEAQTHQNETMPIFCRSKLTSALDAEQYPLLEYQWKEVDTAFKANRPKYDVNRLFENFRCGDGTRESLWRCRERSNSSSIGTSRHCTSKEVASAWLKMKSQSEEVRPLRNSTRCNVVMEEQTCNSKCNRAHYSRALPYNIADTSSQKGIGLTMTSGMGATEKKFTLEKARRLTDRHRTNWGWSGKVPQTRQQQPRQQQPRLQQHEKQPQCRTSIFAETKLVPAPLVTTPPNPPPYISYNRRFRICYGIMSEWRSAVDAKSGRTYYFNVKTRATQWRKPIELATDAEREEMERKERTQKAFFAAMEANILKSMATGKVIDKEESLPKPNEAPASALPKPAMVRTISTMDENILTNLVNNVATTESVLLRRSQGSGTMARIAEGSASAECEMSISDFFMKSSDGGFGMSDEDIEALKELSEITKEMASSTGDDNDVSKAEIQNEEEEDLRSGLKERPRPISEESLTSFNEIEEEEKEEDLRSGLKEKPKLIKKNKPKPVLKKRNTCGTIYLKTTMSDPDKDATIKCVCGVFRTHILSSIGDGGVYNARKDAYKVFNDRDSQRSSVGGAELSLLDLKLDEAVPTLEDIANFYRDVFFRAQMESDCIIMSLIYVERLIKVTGGKLRPRLSNWRSLLFACLILSSKVWDDLSMWNADFSQTCPAGVCFSLKRINELELAILNALKFTVKVPASEYAKYYFLLRSMLIKSGLGGDDMRSMNPLDVFAAQKLEKVSTSYQTVADTKKRVSQQDNLRSKSMGDVEKQKMLGGSGRKMNLEHIVQM